MSMAQKGNGRRTAQDSEHKANWKSCTINLLAIFSLCYGNLTLSTQLHQGSSWFVLPLLSLYGNKSDQTSRCFCSFKCHHVLLCLLISLITIFFSILND